MKILILLLLPFIGVSQVTKVSNLNMYYPFDFKYSGKTPQGDSTWDGRLSQSFTDSLKKVVADLKTANERIARLEALAPGLPVPVVITTGNYTLTAADNGKTIYVYNGATITLPVLNEGFECIVARMGTARPKFTAPNVSLRLRSNFTPLSVQYSAVMVRYKEGEVLIH